MPNSRLHCSFLCIYTVFISLFIPSLALANTDPKTSTPTVTGSIVETTPSVSVGDTTAPTTPILISPSDGTYTNDDTPEFVWTQSSDPNGNTLHYTFHLNGIATYLGISNVGNSAGVGYTARIDAGQIKLTPTSGLSDGQYSWYVEAIDPSNNKASSASWSLTIDRQSPTLAITSVGENTDLTLHSSRPEEFEGLIFDINGAGNTEFTFITEPYSSITLQILNIDGSLHSTTTWDADSIGQATAMVTLIEGGYLVNLSAVDRAANTVALPQFSLNVTTPQITVPLPELPGLPTQIQIPLTPPNFDSLPASISQVSSRLSSALLPITLLAAIAIALLVFLWRRKPNIILDDKKGMPLSNTIIYHSIPTSKSNFSPIYTTKYKPVSFRLQDNDLGRLYIPHLGRYSTLTIRTSDSLHLLSICKTAKVYSITL